MKVGGSSDLRHDLNNLLAAIKLRACAALQRCPDDSEAADALRQIATTAGEAGELVARLLPVDTEQTLEPEPAIGTHAAEVAPGSAEGARGRERILVVEDEENLRLVIGTALRERGYEVVTANDGEGALEALRVVDRPIDLLLSDVLLPGMDGKTLAEHVLDVCPGVKVVWMTGYTDQPLTGFAGAGARLLPKPFNLTEMEETVRDVLDA